MDLMHLTDAELIAVGCRLNGGTFGADSARKNKLAKVAHIREMAREKYGENQYRVTDTIALSVLNARKAGPQGGEGAGMGGGSDDGSADDGGSEDQGIGELPDGQRMGTPDDGPTEPFSLDVGGERGGDSGAQDDSDDADDAESTEGGETPSEGPQGRPVDALEARVREMIEEAMETATDGAAEDIAEAIESRLGDAVAQIRNELGERAPREVALKVPAMPAVTLRGKHPIFSKLLALCALPAELRQPIMLVGPAGSGKSYVCRQVADALERPFGALSLSADMTRGAIEGRVMPLGQGVYVPSEFIRLYEAGGVYLFDEIDAAASEVLVTVNAALANGGAHVEARAISGLPTYVPKHDDTVMLAAANTFGFGPTAQYVGRAQMDAATLDRWVILFMDYDRQLLASLTGTQAPDAAPWIPEARTEKAALGVLHTLGVWLNDIEERATSRGLKRVVGTRSRLRARALVAAGFRLEEAQDVLLAGWSADEKAQVGA